MMETMRGATCTVVYPKRFKSAPSTLSFCEKEVVNVFESCPICCEAVRNLHTMSACGCVACSKCLETWVNEQMPEAKARRQLRVRCGFGATCKKSLPQAVVLQVDAARQVADQIETRFRLQANPFYSEEMQVECIKADCIGIGYLGSETIMCMICEEQWAAEEETIAKPIEDGYELDRHIKRCPGCRVRVEKTGGCNHMKCSLCNFEWWWHTGAPFR